MARQALGRGLRALISSKELADPQPHVEAGESVSTLAIGSLSPCPFQPRKTFDLDSLNELAASIKSRGIQQPLIARPVEKGYEIIAGERRWRAAQQAGLTHVPVIIRKATDQTVLEWALIENLQRHDLNPIEEADGYHQLIHRFKLTQEQVADQVGKNRATVANSLRLLGLSEDVRQMVIRKQISVGHAKALLSLAQHSEQNKASQEVIKRSLNVRQTEELVRGLLATEPESKKITPSSGSSSKPSTVAKADWKSFEQRLQRAVGAKVKVVGNSQSGRIELYYATASELDRLSEKLGLQDES